jgi:hypothetical protein
MTGHLSWEVLNDLTDELLPAAEVDAARAHLESCRECAESLAVLRATVSQVSLLARETVEPPAELWDDVRATIDARKIASLPLPGAPRQKGWWMTPGRAAAAAIALMAVSSATTVVLVRGAGNDVAVISAANASGAVLPVSWQAAERGYLASVTELRDQLEAERGKLSLSTISAVERAVATIDVAIAEAREALLRDPANATLSELLASHYRQKVELLRRATQLDAAT